MIFYYVAAKRANEKFFIFGPFLTECEAAARLPDARGFDLDQCPETFRTKTKARPGAPVWYVSRSGDDCPAWQGTGYSAADQAALV